MWLKFKTAVRRFVTKKLSLYRPGSFPYITGDSFRALAQHVFDESIDLDPSNVLIGDVVFVRTNYLKDFFEKKHPQISVRYVLISHNEDMSVTEDLLKYIDEKIIHWFAENAMVRHEKITPIPIGIQNFYSYKDGFISFFDSIRKENSKKEIGIAYGFNLKSNLKERSKAFDLIKDSPLGIYVKENDAISYLKKISKITNILSPEGCGPDCVRTWEAIYMGNIPIVKKLPFSEFFVENGLPMILIDSWDQIKIINREYLQIQNSNKKMDSPMIWMDYWIKLIQDKRKNYEK